jgi:hypothetical protein
MATPKKKSNTVSPTTATKPTITADVLRNLPDSEVQDLLRALGPAKAEELKYNWRFWARPEQLEPMLVIGTLGLLLQVVVGVRPELVLSGFAIGS